MKELLEAENPKAIPGAKKLAGQSEDRWRVRQGNYRIIFTVESGEVTHMKHTYKGTIWIQEVIHRRDAY